MGECYCHILNMIIAQKVPNVIRLRGNKLYRTIINTYIVLEMRDICLAGAL